MPHAGAMVLLDRLDRWDARSVLCRTGSHLRPDNPLRHDGCLAAVCGIEYGLQAAALHGALVAGGVAQVAGYAASVRGVLLRTKRLDDERHGTLLVEARLETQEKFGMIYAFEIRDAAGVPLLTGRAAIALPR